VQVSTFWPLEQVQTGVGAGVGEDTGVGAGVGQALLLCSGFKQQVLAQLQLPVDPAYSPDLG